MKRCDFSFVSTTIRQYISDDHNMNQSAFLDALFYSFFCAADKEPVVFDFGLICRWINGQTKISPRISEFYTDSSNQKKLARDIERYILPLMYDSSMAAQDIYTTLLQDNSISDKIKKLLTRHYPCKNKRSEATFFASVLCFSMKRRFIKRDAKTLTQLAARTLSPILTDFIYSSDAPNPCKHFCGREQELTELHELLQKSSKVFLQGIAGIGKSELAKAYAKQYNKEYTNILYIIYTGDLRQDIIDMDFVDDLLEYTAQERFRKHNRFLRSLKDDTLLIIDNFNATATQDELLSVILRYRCQVLFTTRSHFENHTYMELEEIKDKQVLLKLVSHFYSHATKHSTTLEQIIDTVHRHTLAVELAARLLETGILKPIPLLNKLREEKVGMNASDTIHITKDGQNQKATYHDHIHTLFSLYKLSNLEQKIIRNLSLMPLTGIHSRLFAYWLQLHNLNTVNDLVEKGVIQAKQGRIIALHPIIQEVAIEETKPSVQNCLPLLTRLHEICLFHGKDVPYYKQLFQTIENITNLIEKDNTETYLLFIKDAFPYMEKYHYEAGMQRLLDELNVLLEDQSVGNISDRILLLDYRAACEKNPQKAIQLEKKALKMLTEITDKNAHLTENIYANLGYLYQQTGQLELAKQNMVHGIELLEQYNLSYTNDAVIQIINYAGLVTDLGDPTTGLSALQKIAYIVQKYNSEQSSDYALIQETMGNIYLVMRDIKQANIHFKKAMSIYEYLFETEPEFVASRKQTILNNCIQAGITISK